MRLRAQVAPFVRSRVVQAHAAQNQSSENEFHCESGQQVRSQLPAEPDVLATEIAEQNAQERIENPMRNHGAMKPDRRLQCVFLDALSPPDQQPGSEAER